MSFADLEALQREISENLSCGRAFAPGRHTVEDRGRCELVLVHPDSGNTMRLLAEVVWIAREGENPGVGVQLIDFDEAVVKALETFEKSEKGGPQSRQPVALLDRVRQYTMAEQMKAAREGGLAERVALERVYGKAVWEILLHNPRLSLPEVARMARKGNIPGPLIDVICANPSWLNSGEVRRALLSNPRLAGGTLEKVLRALPRSELARVASQNSHSIAVRRAAKKIIGG
jgi:hypothetical protein